MSLLVQGSSQVDENRLWDVICSPSGKPRLKIARDFFNPLSQADVLKLGEAFEYWRDYKEYIVLKAENSLNGEVKHFAVKCSKRGNDVFSKRLDSRLGFLKTNIRFFDPLLFDEHKIVKTKLLWVTLTYNSHRCGLSEAWNNISKEFNTWITNLRNKYGSIHYVCFPQAFPGKEGQAFGYPHFHIIVLFDDVEFKVIRRMEKDREGKLGFVYRVKEKYELQDQGKWHSFIDVKALSSMRAVWNYAKKHCYNAGYGNSKEATLNNSIMWCYRKRSFNMSGEFRKRYCEFIKSMHNSKTFVQNTLDGENFSVWKFTLLGIFSSFELFSDEDPPGWTVALDKELVDSLVEERLGYK